MLKWLHQRLQWKIYFLLSLTLQKYFIRRICSFQKSAVAIKGDFKNVNKHDGVYGCRFYSFDSFLRVGLKCLTVHSVVE